MPLSTSPSIPDERLAVQAREEDGERAFGQLVERYGGRVLSVLQRRLGGDYHAARDLSQEVWVRVYRHLARYDPEQSFRGWIFTIALNAARDEARRRSRSKIDLAEGVLETAPDPRSDADRRGDDGADRVLIEATLARVPEPFRTALVLVDVEGLSYEEAADAVECALGTMKSRVARGRSAFRDVWTRRSGMARPKSRGSRRVDASTDGKSEALAANADVGSGSTRSEQLGRERVSQKADVGQAEASSTPNTESGDE